MNIKMATKRPSSVAAEPNGSGAKSTAAPKSSRNPPKKRKSLRENNQLISELEEQVERASAKVQINSKIDPVLAREVNTMIGHAGRGETLSQFVATAIENEYHRRKGTRRVKETTLSDLVTQIEEVKNCLAILGEFTLAEARETKALTKLIGQAVGVSFAY